MTKLSIVPDQTNIREYEQALYIYWLGSNLGTVKIGHTNNPNRRLAEFTRETGTPGHKAGFAAIVWLDRRREAVELAVHRRLASLRRDGEWFAVTAEQALNAIEAEASAMGIRYEVEDLADITGQRAQRRAEETERQILLEIEEADRRAMEELAHRRSLETIAAQAQLERDKQAAMQMQLSVNQSARLAREADAAATASESLREATAAKFEANKAAAIQAALAGEKYKAANRKVAAFWALTLVLGLGSFVSYRVIQATEIAERDAAFVKLADMERDNEKLATNVKDLQAKAEAAAKSNYNVVAEKIDIIAAKDLRIARLESDLNKKPKEVIRTVTKEVPVEVVKIVEKETPAKPVAGLVPNKRDNIFEAQQAVARAENTCKSLYPKYQVGRSYSCNGDAGRYLRDAENKLAYALNNR